MDELIIYKDQAKNIITAAIEKSTNKPPTEIIQIVADYADGVKALSSIPLDDKVQLLTNEENTKRAINKQLDDIPWFWRNDNGLLYYICVRLGVWLYQDFQHKQLDKKARAIMVENAITTILSDITLDEWKAIINSANTNPDLYYFYVRDHINKPILTAEQIKNNIQRFLIGRGVDGDFTDIDKAFSQDFDEIAIVLNCFNKSGYGRYEETLYNQVINYLDGWLFVEVRNINPEFASDDNYSDGLSDWGYEIVNDYISDIMDGETYITINEWKTMLLKAQQES